MEKQGSWAGLLLRSALKALTNHKKLAPWLIFSHLAKYKD